MTDYTKEMGALESRIGYEFKDKNLLVRALTHPSYGDGRKKVQNYERLEFLGCLLYTSPSPRDRTRSRMPSSA